MKGNYNIAIIMFLILFSLIYVFNGGINNAILIIDSDYEKQNIGNNISNSSFNFQFRKDNIKNCYSNSENYKCFINLYINEFKNNCTIEELKTIKFNNNYYYIEDEYSYKMSFIIDKQDFNYTNFNLYGQDNQILNFNKSNDLIIDKIEIEYYGTKYNLEFILTLYLIYILLILFILFIMFQNI